MFDLERGLPGRPPPSGAHITIAAGHVEQVDPFVHPTAADPVATLDDARLLRDRREPVSFGQVTWGGRTGILFLAPPYLFGGQLGDHLVFEWRGGEETYLYSLHSWRPIADTAATLRTMVRSIG